MENIMQGLLYLLIFIVGLIIRDFIPGYVNKKGENLATKEDIAEITRSTEEVKAEIKIELDKITLKQNQLMTNFELFTIKKHECYPELYKLIEVSNGAIRSLRGVSRELSFQDLNTKDIESYMNDKKISTYDIEKILKDWDENKLIAISSLRGILNRINYNEAEEKYTDAHNYFYFMVLYLSDDIKENAKELLELLYNLWNNYDLTFPIERMSINGEEYTNEEIISKIDSLRMNLELKMREELLPEE